MLLCSRARRLRARVVAPPGRLPVLSDVPQLRPQSLPRPAVRADARRVRRIHDHVGPLHRSGGGRAGAAGAARRRADAQQPVRRSRIAACQPAMVRRIAANRRAARRRHRSDDAQGEDRGAPHGQPGDRLGADPVARPQQLHVVAGGVARRRDQGGPQDHQLCAAAHRRAVVQPQPVARQRCADRPRGPRAHERRARVLDVLGAGDQPGERAALGAQPRDGGRGPLHVGAVRRAVCARHAGGARGRRAPDGVGVLQALRGQPDGALDRGGRDARPARLQRRGDAARPARLVHAALPGVRRAGARLRADVLVQRAQRRAHVRRRVADEHRGARRVGLRRLHHDRLRRGRWRLLAAPLLGVARGGGARRAARRHRPRLRRRAARPAHRVGARGGPHRGGRHRHRAAPLAPGAHAPRQL